MAAEPADRGGADLARACQFGLPADRRESRRGRHDSRRQKQKIAARPKGEDSPGGIGDAALGWASYRINEIEVSYGALVRSILNRRLPPVRAAQAPAAVGS
jgi:hypothetical protein